MVCAGHRLDPSIRLGESNCHSGTSKHEATLPHLTESVRVPGRPLAHGLAHEQVILVDGWRSDGARRGCGARACSRLEACAVRPSIRNQTVSRRSHHRADAAPAQGMGDSRRASTSGHRLLQTGFRTTACERWDRGAHIHRLRPADGHHFSPARNSARGHVCEVVCHSNDR